MIHRAGKAEPSDRQHRVNSLEIRDRFDRDRAEILSDVIPITAADQESRALTRASRDELSYRKRVGDDRQTRPSRELLGEDLRCRSGVDEQRVPGLKKHRRAPRNGALFIGLFGHSGMKGTLASQIRDLVGGDSAAMKLPNQAASIENAEIPPNRLSRYAEEPREIVDRHARMRAYQIGDASASV